MRLLKCQRVPSLSSRKASGLSMSRRILQGWSADQPGHRLACLCHPRSALGGWDPPASACRRAKVMGKQGCVRATGAKAGAGHGSSSTSESSESIDGAERHLCADLGVSGGQETKTAHIPQMICADVCFYPSLSPFSLSFPSFLSLFSFSLSPLSFLSFLSLSFSSFSPSLPLSLSPSLSLSLSLALSLSLSLSLSFICSSFRRSCFSPFSLLILRRVWGALH